MKKTPITVQAVIQAPVEKVWRFYTRPEHITKWNHASEDWHSPWAENDLRAGGRFRFRMEAKVGGAGFDFEGTYNEVKTNQLVSYTLADLRKVKVTFSGDQTATHLSVQFEAEQTNPIEMQRDGWQAILDNFKKYVEVTTDDHL